MRVHDVLSRLRWWLPTGSTLSHGAWRRRQHWMTVLLVVHVVVLLAVQVVVTDHLAHNAGEMVPIAVATVVALIPRAGRRLRTAAVTFGLVACSALLVHMTGGLIESHFHFFAVIAIVTLYQEWMPFALAFAYVVVHHGVVGVLSPTTVYNHAAAWNRPVLWALIHGAYVALAAAANLVAWRLNESERERTERVLNATGEAIYGIDRRGRIAFANPAMTRLTGWSLSELEDRDHHAVLGHVDADGRPLDAVGCPVCLHIAEADGRSCGDQLFLRRDGSRFPVEYASHPVPSGSQADGLSVVVNFRDVTERRAFEQELNRQALHDALTGLPNRTLLLDRIGLALAALRRAPQAVAVIFCDIDHFKRINDSLGHEVGDRLLCQLAVRLRSAVRPDDTVARFGGDEFVICCPTVDSEADAVRIAERLLTLFELPFDLGATALHVRGSFGIAISEDLDTSSAELIRQADQAMYAAKHGGGGAIRIYEPSMAEQVNHQVFISEELRRALDEEQFEVHYQPTIELATERITGIEALLRWHHPDHGTISPATFIPLAEEAGLIIPIGRWVLERACRQVCEWNRRRGMPLTVSVNVSGVQLRDADFADQVLEILAATGCRPEWLLLEITESVLITTLDTAAPALRRLRDRGIHIALDDFGTGYSSLTYLRQLPVDVIKVDRSFVSGVDEGTDQQSLVSAVVNMARTLSMRTIAEGVEEENERATLMAVGCDGVQGYLYGRPQPADQISRLLDHGEGSGVGAVVRPASLPVER